MHEIIDVPTDVQEFAVPLAEAGVKCVIRYYNHRNSPVFPSKRLTRQELQALHGAGLSVAAVFQQRGGAGGNIADLDGQSGLDDAQQALALAAELAQPEGSAIYFAVDFDYFRVSELAQITSYFESVKQTLDTKYRIGVYGSGTVGRHLKRQGLVDHLWLAGATGWSGTRAALADGEWTIFQQKLSARSEIGGFDYDGNVVNPSLANFGQFDAGAPLDTPRGQGAAALFRVTARSGLNLRVGPGESFRVRDTVPANTILAGLGEENGWIKVDLDGDGQVDGFMFGGFLEGVSGGLPIARPVADLRLARRPIDVAREELNLGVSEIAGPDSHNPRILMYHRTTAGGAASDETPWCSSFANYCVEQAGLQGTGSKAALSWHQTGWGRDVTDAPEEGDLAVFRRHSPRSSGGHVGFFLSEEGDQIRLLGGNQGNRISIALFPKDGRRGDTRYELLSIRRA